MDEDDLEAEVVFGAVRVASLPADEVLVVLDRSSDSFPLAVIPAGAVAEAQRLAVAIGARFVAVTGEQGPAEPRRRA